MRMVGFDDRSEISALGNAEQGLFDWYWRLCVKLEQARGSMLSLARVYSIALSAHYLVPAVSSTCLLKPLLQLVDMWVRRRTL